MTKVTEKEMTGKLALLHKGGSKADLVSHWRPEVLLNCTNQIIAYIVNERLTEWLKMQIYCHRNRAVSAKIRAQVSTSANYMVSPTRTNVSKNVSSELTSISRARSTA